MLPWPTLLFIFVGCDTMFHPSPNITGYPATQNLLPRHQQRAGDGSDLPAHGRLQHVAGQDIAPHLRWVVKRVATARWIAMNPWRFRCAPSLWPLDLLDFLCWDMLRRVERTLQYCKATRVKSDYLSQTMLLSQIFHQTMCWNQFLKTSRLLGCAFRLVRPPTMIISPVTSKAKHSSSQTGWFQTITIDKTQSMRQFCLDPFGVKHSGMPKLHAIRSNPQNQQPLVGSFRFVWKYCTLNLDALICHQLMESHIFRLSPLDVPENGPYTPKNYQFKKKMVINHQIWGLSHFWAPFFVSFLEPQTSQTSQTTKRLFPMVKKNATHQMVETCWN